MTSSRVKRLALVFAFIAPSSVTRAQDSSNSALRHGGLIVRLGSDEEDRLRLSQILGEASPSGFLIRSASTSAVRRSSARGQQHGLTRCDLRWAFIAPDAELIWNSRLPFPRNDGGVWAGRGMTLRTSAGAGAVCGRVRLVVAPELWYAQNRNFPVLPSGNRDRSGFASPYYSGLGSSADLPLRFGNEPLLVIAPGQTSLEGDLGHLVLGVSSENQWWGPGIRNALVLSSHAAGIPNAYVRTRLPVALPIGDVEARWMVGALSESPYFDSKTQNDLRSLSGLVVALRTRMDSNLTIGGARVVYAPIRTVMALPARFLDALGRWGEGADIRAAQGGRAADQLTSLFFRWMLPRHGFESYAEWARVILPGWRSLLVAPQFSQGYTLGLQWASGPVAKGMWRTQLEFTSLEQPVISRGDEPPTFYVSPTVTQGYTQRGQVIGAAIGPGSSSQWFALDRVTARHSTGALLGRIRWNSDRFFFHSSGFSRFAHDVSFFAGVRGSTRARALDYAAELIFEKRLNYLFQSMHQGFNEDRSFDMRNISLRISATPGSRTR